MAENQRKSNIKSIIFAIVVVILVAVVVIGVTSAKKSNRPFFLFGYSMLWVETGSMSPTIPEKSYILVKKSDGTDIKVNDVITFVCEDPSLEVYGYLITHRVVEITDDGFRTKGDYVLSAVDNFTVDKEDVVAVYKKNMPFMTFIGRVFSSAIGLIVLMFLFVGSAAFIYVPDIVKGMKDDEQPKDLEKEKEAEMNRLIEEEIAKLSAQETASKENTEKTEDKTEENQQKEKQ